MVSVRNNAKLLTRILAVLLITIWGEVAYQVVRNRRQPHATTSAPAVYHPVNTNNKRAPCVFKDNVRDPFAYFHPVTHVRKNPKIVPLIVHIWTPPPVSLEGVMLSGGKRTAILSDRTGRTYFLSQGDTLEGVRVLDVRHSRVAYSYDKKDTCWIIPR